MNNFSHIEFAMNWAVKEQAAIAEEFQKNLQGELRAEHMGFFLSAIKHRAWARVMDVLYSLRGVTPYAAILISKINFLQNYVNELEVDITREIQKNANDTDNVLFLTTQLLTLKSSPWDAHGKKEPV